MLSNLLSSKEYFRQLNVIFIALLATQMLMAIAAFIFINFNMIIPVFKNTSDPFYILVPILLIFFIILGNIVFRKKLLICKSQKEIIKKMTFYREAIIVLLASIETVSIFSSIAYLLTSKMMFLVLTVTIIVYFLTKRPNSITAINHLELNNTEQILVNDPSAPICEKVVK